MISLLASAVVLAAEDPDAEMRGLIDDAGPIAGLFVLALGIAIFFLWRSMNKQMKRIDPSLPPGRDDREQARDRQRTQDAIERGEAADPDEPPSH